MSVLDMGFGLAGCEFYMGHCTCFLDWRVETSASCSLSTSEFPKTEDPNLAPS